MKIVPIIPCDPEQCAILHGEGVCPCEWRREQERIVSAFAVIYEHIPEDDCEG